MADKYYSGNITELKPNEIFVFGSNASGFHGGGAAAFALAKFGAIMGQGHGLQGQSYGIDSMSGLDELGKEAKRFIEFAKEHTELTFYVTRIGCGIAGYTDDEVKPLFEGATELDNVKFPIEWK